MSNKLFIFAVISILGLGACQNKVVKPSVEPAGKQPKLALGSLEHRGRQYSLRDLMDPAFRAASSDNFVRNFDPDITYVRKSFMSPEVKQMLLDAGADSSSIIIL